MTETNISKGARNINSIAVSGFPRVSGVLGSFTTAVVNKTEKLEQCHSTEWGRTLHLTSKMIFSKLGECFTQSCQKVSFNLKWAMIHHGKGHLLY